MSGILPVSAQGQAKVACRQDAPPTSQTPASLATADSIATDSLSVAVLKESMVGIGSAYVRKDDTA
jgi:hypothetical protein